MSVEYTVNLQGVLTSVTNAANQDSLTSDIGALAYNGLAWRAGITWNISNNSDDVYVNNNRLNYYPVVDKSTTGIETPLSSIMGVISTDGNDTSGNGSITLPYKSIETCLTNMPNIDTVYIRGGEYNFNSVNTINKSVEIKPYQNEKVVFNGTSTINELRDNTHSDGTGWNPVTSTIVLDNATLQTITLHSIKLKDSVSIWQLFHEKDNTRNEVINARWPSAQWSDDSVYSTNNWGHGYYNHSDVSGTNRDYNNGEIVDIAQVNTNLYDFIKKQQEIKPGFTINDSLINLNVGSFKTYTKKVNSTNIDDVNNIVRLTYNPVALWKEKHHYYYLENKLEFLNSQNEWFFDDSTKYLYVWLNNNETPGLDDMRAKINTYALDIRQNNVSISNINFFATTLKASGADNLNIKNCNFLYPNCYAHMINKINYDSTVNWSQNEVYNSNTYITNSDNCIIEGCVFKYTDGSAIEMGGEKNTLSDSYFTYIDKTVANLSSVMTSVRLNGNNNIIKYNTIHKTGASSTINPGNNAVIEYNNLYDTGHLQSDGAMIHCMVAQQTNVRIRNNWCHDSIKYGIRFDGDGDGYHGYIHHNVCWNCEGGIMVKGGILDTNGVSVGGHFVYNNTVYNSQSKNDIMVLNTQKGVDINYGSVVMNNLAEKIYGHRSDPEVLDTSRITVLNNYSPISVTQVLVNANINDFRPINDGNIVNAANTIYLNKDFKYGLVVIPDKVGTVDITTISNSVFLGNTDITHVEISKNIVTIGESAFRNCTNLLEVSFSEPSSLATIGISAFKECINLESIQIPDSVSVILDNAFDTCKKLKNITIGLDHSQLSLTSIGNNVFDKCYNLENVIIHKNPKDFSIGTGNFRMGSSIDGEQAFRIIKNPAYTAIPYTIDIAKPTPRTDYGTLTLTSGHGITINNLENNHTDSIEMSKMINWTLDILSDIILEHSIDVTIHADFSDTLDAGILGQAGANSDGTNSITLSKEYLHDEYLVQINNKLEPYLYGVFLHEVIHCLGIRIDAGFSGMPSFTSPPGNPNTLVPTSSGLYTTFYIGSKGVDRYNQILDINNHGDQNRTQTISVLDANDVSYDYRFLFLENDGGAGTVLSHPDEGQDYRDYNGIDYPSIGGEITTGYYNQTGNVISVLTGGFLEDMGYKINYDSQYLLTKTRDADYYYIKHIYNTILDDQFSGDNFKIFDIPTTLETMGKRSFMNCSQLLRIQIPNLVTIIPERTFYNCTNIEYIKLGIDKNSENRLTTIGAEAFAQCTALESIELHTNNPYHIDNITISQSSFNDTNLTIGIQTIKDAFTLISLTEEEYTGFDQDTINKIKTISLADYNTITTIDHGIEWGTVTTAAEKQEKRDRQHKLVKLLFSENPNRNKFKITKDSLGFENLQFVQKPNLVCIRAGSTISMASDISSDSSVYCALDNGDNISINPSSGTPFTITKSNNRYTLSSSNSISVNILAGGSNYNAANNTGYFVDEDSVVINNDDYLFGGILSNGQYSSSTGGDPYINTINGKLYKLDNANCCCRMIQGVYENKNIIINVEMTMDSKIREMEMNKWIDNVESFREDRLDNSIYHSFNQSFYTKIYIKHGDDEILYDLLNSQVILQKGKLSIDIVSNRFKTNLCMYNRDTSFKTSIIRLGLLSIVIKEFENKQLRNTIDLNGGKYIKNAYGFIVNPMNTQTARVSLINDSVFLDMMNSPMFVKSIEEIFESMDITNTKKTQKLCIDAY